MKILNPAIRSYIKLRWSYIDHYFHSPINAQITTFNDLISSAQFTEFGKKYDFPHINNYKDYKSRVPAHSYEDIFPYIKRMMDGEKNILWPSSIEWFAKSSGTTSDKSKFIPVSNESIEENHFRGIRDVLALYFKNFPQSEFMSGKALLMGGSHKVHEVNDSVSYGDLSAVLLQNMVSWQNMIRTPGLDIALLEDWEEKLEKNGRGNHQRRCTLPSRCSYLDCRSTQQNNRKKQAKKIFIRYLAQPGIVYPWWRKLCSLS